MTSILNLFSDERRQRQILHDVAIASSNQIQNLFKLHKEGNFDINLNQKAFTKVFEHVENSPAIYWIDDKQFILRYPKNSIPYSDKFKDKCKFVECISGKLYDKNSNTKLFAGDKLKVYPTDNFEPHTRDEVCYLRVVIGDCNQKLESIC